LNQIIDPGLSAQTSLLYEEDKMKLLYEQADYPERTADERIEDVLIQNLRVLVPTRFVFRELSIAKKSIEKEVDSEEE
jgi:hypothetical protein